MGPERDGRGQDTDNVQARTEDLRTFFENGERYVSSLRGIFDEIVRKRSAVNGAVGSADTPQPLVARGGHGVTSDPLAEQIAEATINNAFVKTIHDALMDSNLTINGRKSIPPNRIDVLLREAGLGTAGEDFDLEADQNLVERLAAAEAKEEIRAEIDDLLGPILDEGVEPYGTTQELGVAIDAYVASLDDGDPERRAAAAEVLVEYGIDLQVNLTTSTHRYEEGRLATMLVNQGLRLMPEDQAAGFADQLANSYPNPTRYGPPKSALEYLVDALDVAENDIGEYEVEIAASHEEWKRSNQPWVRRETLDRLINSTIDDDGAISSGGQLLVNYTLDTYPEVVELSAEHRFHTDPFDDDPDLPDSFDIRATLATALASPNYGLDDVQWAAAKRVDEIDALLELQPSDAEIERLWLERRIRIFEMAGGDDEQQALIIEAMGGGIPGGRVSLYVGGRGGPTCRIRLVSPQDQRPRGPTTSGL